MIDNLKNSEPETVAVDIKTAARMLSVSTKTIRKAIKDKELRAFRPTRALRIRVAELNAYMTRLEKRDAGVNMPKRQDDGKFEPGESTPLLK